MFQGSVASIHIAPAEGAPTISVEEAHAVPGKGLRGDRHYREEGMDPEDEITLIESETLEALARDHSLFMQPGETRRNVVTRGVPLNHLVGREFRVGGIRLRGVKLCEPCSHLARLTQAEALPALVHRGGLRAQILEEGVIRVGDRIEPA